MPHRTFLFAAGSLMAGLLGAQVPVEERVPITDPDRLAALGMPRDATNVHQWAKADSTRGQAAEASAATPDSWGTATGYTTVMGTELRAGRSGVNGLYDGLIRDVGGTYCGYSEASYPAQVAGAEVRLPDGAALGDFRYWAYDSDPAFWLTFDVLELCQAPGNQPPTVTVLGSADTFGSAGNYFGLLDLGGLRVDARNCGYLLRVFFIPSDFECRDNALQVRKMQVTWTRQVGPAPAVATFNDVPTDSPYFTFVEALVRSGITTGCGGGSFCPSAALTRGQMAVFLAKGLGLAWP